METTGEVDRASSAENLFTSHESFLLVWTDYYDCRYGYFVFEQPGQLDYREEGGPTDSCSPQMSNGRGPFKSTKNFMKKYNLDLTAATFLIIDTNEASMEVGESSEMPD